MLSHAAPPFCTFEKCFRMLRRRFAPLKNAFACCAAVLYPCKMLSHAAPPFYTLAKCFRMLRRHFTPLQSAFARCAAILHANMDFFFKVSLIFSLRPLFCK